MCGETNTLNHSLICKKGGYVSMRHNSLVSLITKLLVSAGCRDVVTEPFLLPKAGVTLRPGSNNARADVSAWSIWNPLDSILRRKSVPRSSSFRKIGKLFLGCIAITKNRRNVLTMPGYWKWREEFSRHYSSQHLVGWERMLKHYSRGLQQR